MSKSQKTPNADILTYLQKMPIYPFDPKIDHGFVEEIVADFGSTLDILEETKAFRWYHIDQATPKLRSARLSLRRWLKNAKQPTRR